MLKQDAQADSESQPFHSGFVSLVGRPNAGKSSLLNKICGQKVSVVTDKPQTTRTQIRGILHRPHSQIVFVDTPGVHKSVSALGERLNDSTYKATKDVDFNCLIIDAKAPFGRGDEFVAEKLNPKKSVVVVNKIDIAKRTQIETQLLASGELDFEAYFPISAKTGKGLEVFLDYLVSRMPEGPPYYGPEMIMDQPEAFWVAELVREQLFRLLNQELPYSVATQVVEWDWPRVRCEIFVERESQKGIVIGKGGKVLKSVGEKVRKQMPKGAYLELSVKVDKNWQHLPRSVERLGY